MTLATSMPNPFAVARRRAVTLPRQTLPLDHPAYTTEARKGWRGYTRRVCVLTTLTAADGVALLKRFLPQANKAWHEGQAYMHLANARLHSGAWSSVADEAAQATFGRPFAITDYRVSGIGRDEFSQEHKAQLRWHIRRQQQHHLLAILHRMAAGRRHETALRECELDRHFIASH